MSFKESLRTIFSQRRTMVLLTLGILTTIAVLVIFRVDEHAMNAINPPDYTCSTDVDCAVKPIARDRCAAQCVNNDWNQYTPILPRQDAMKCSSPVYRCSCVENRCATHDLSYSTDPADCDALPGYEGERCIRAVTWNIIRNSTDQDDCARLPEDDLVACEQMIAQNRCKALEGDDAKVCFAVVNCVRAGGDEEECRQYHEERLLG
jgi:hypothetical protein